MRALSYVCALVLVLAGRVEAGEPPSVAALVGDARCTADSECRTVAVGHQACGGPAGWVAWSSSRTDEAALAAAAEAEGRRSPTGFPNRVSTCGIVADPGAFCARSERAPGKAAESPGTCRLRPKHPAAAPLSDR